eukprot:scaffold90_cov264-Pinguiococcus_pyrenoidosus.AAC.14
MAQPLRIFWRKRTSSGAAGASASATLGSASTPTTVQTLPSVSARNSAAPPSFAPLCVSLLRESERKDCFCGGRPQAIQLTCVPKSCTTSSLRYVYSKKWNGRHCSRILILPPFLQPLGRDASTEKRPVSARMRAKARGTGAQIQLKRFENIEQNSARTVSGLFGIWNIGAVHIPYQKKDGMGIPVYIRKYFSDGYL